MAMQDLSGEEVMRLIEARERRRARPVVDNEPMGMASPEMLAAFERSQTPEQPPAPAVEEPQRMPLVAPPAPPLPMGAMTPEEGQALAEFQTAQGRAVNVESVLPFLRAGQQITQAWTGAPVDVQGLEAIQQTARRPSEEAAQRMALAREFAKRRMEGQAQEQRMGLSEREMALREAGLAQEGVLAQQQMALRAMAEQRMAEAEARRGRTGPKPVDEMAQRKKELEVRKLEQELAAMEGGRMTPEQEAKALQLQKLRKEVSGEETPAEQRKKREAIVEIRERGANIDRNLKELEKLVEEEGTFNVVGPQNKMLKDKLYQIAIDIAKLMDPGSVAREGEVNAIMKFSLFEPGPFMRDSTAIELIQNLRKGMNARLQEAYRVRGIAPDVAEGTGLSPEKQKRLQELRAKQQRGE